MSAQAVLGFRERREPALGRSFALALLMHLVLFALVFLGVRWQSHAPETVTVELWDAAPPPPPPAPKVEPKPEPPKPLPKPEPKPVAKPEPKTDPAFEKRLQEQIAQEQRALEEQSRIAEQQRQERALRELIASKQAAARQGAVGAWVNRISASIRRNIPVAVVEEVQGNPEAIFDVTLLPTGEVLSAVRRKSSGNRAYDEAVERAILKSSPLPKPDDPSVFQRRLELRFRPQDE